MRPEVLEAMVPHLARGYGNPTGAHSESRRAAALLDEAREQVASLLGAEPGEVVFTSGGTEADNLAVKGVHALKGGRAVCSAVEHQAVTASVVSIQGDAVPVDSEGVVDLNALNTVMGPDVSLVSVMLANNEVGTIQPVGQIAKVVHELAPGALFHTDAVQAPAWLDVAELAADADLVSVSAHKMGGPQGVGALVVRNGAELLPLLEGGGQERGRRSGTPNLAGILGMAAALQVATSTRSETVERVKALRDRMVEGILSGLEGVEETGRGADRLANIVHLRFQGVESEELVALLDEKGVCVSAGASCSSGAMEPSHVLMAMGFTRSEANSGVRLSLGWNTTEADVDAAGEALVTVVERLRHVRVGR